MIFCEPQDIGFILGPHGLPTLRIFPSPQFPLHQIIESGHRYGNVENFPATARAGKSWYRELMVIWTRSRLPGMWALRE